MANSDREQEFVSILDHIVNLLPAADETDWPAAISFVRHSDAYADLTIIIKNVTQVRPEVLAAELELNPSINSCRFKANRISLRLSDEIITAYGNQLLAGYPAGLVGHDLLKAQSFMVDYCDPNATKSLHVGHLRNITLGHSIASALTAAGADVIRQSVICDFGRNVCEALAGYEMYFKGQTPQSTSLKCDLFVGKCYEAYVSGLNIDDKENEDPDAPILRELQLQDDLAQHILERWCTNDVGVHSLWNDIRYWALEGQSQTLRRLGMEINRALYESESFERARKLAEEGLLRGIFKKTPEGQIIYDTGREEYRVVPLLRRDGFPTEHMRALALWYKLQSTFNNLKGCIHIMGDEWLISTLYREEILRQFLDCPLYDVYHKIPYGLVILHGSNMKSSKGNAILIDDMLDSLITSEKVKTLVTQARDNISPMDLVRIVILGFFLNVPATKRIDFAWERFVNERSNPGWILAQAWAMVHSHEGGNTVNADPSNKDYRFAILQSQALRRLLFLSVTFYDISFILRHLIHLANWYISERHQPAVDRIVRTTLQSGLKSIGAIL